MRIISQIPYGGSFLWRDPLTRQEVRGTTFEQLMHFAYQERKANGVPVGLDFEQEVERDICANYPDDCENVPPGTRRKSHWSMGEIVRGTMTFARHKLTGSQLVAQATANERAAICASCPQAVFFSKPCAGLCSELVNVLSGTGSKSTPYDHDLRACGICGCWTRVAVWFPLDTQCPDVNEEMAKQFAAVPRCWKQCTT
jgi:hypothetical protein